MWLSSEGRGRGSRRPSRRRRSELAPPPRRTHTVFSEPKPSWRHCTARAAVLVSPHFEAGGGGIALPRVRHAHRPPDKQDPRAPPRTLGSQPFSPRTTPVNSSPPIKLHTARFGTHSHSHSRRKSICAKRCGRRGERSFRLPPTVNGCSMAVGCSAVLTSHTIAARSVVPPPELVHKEILRMLFSAVCAESVSVCLRCGSCEESILVAKPLHGTISDITVRRARDVPSVRSIFLTDASFSVRRPSLSRRVRGHHFGCFLAAASLDRPPESDSFPRITRGVFNTALLSSLPCAFTSQHSTVGSKQSQPAATTPTLGTKVDSMS